MCGSEKSCPRDHAVFDVFEGATVLKSKATTANIKYSYSFYYCTIDDSATIACIAINIKIYLSDPARKINTKVER
jgi:hypothetical protein